MFYTGGIIRIHQSLLKVENLSCSGMKMPNGLPLIKLYIRADNVAKVFSNHASQVKVMK